MHTHAKKFKREIVTKQKILKLFQRLNVKSIQGVSDMEAAQNRTVIRYNDSSAETGIPVNTSALADIVRWMEERPDKRRLAF
jgi:hypothetical protein